MRSARPQHKQKSRIQTIRFGEFLCERRLLSDNQLLASLADCWSNGGRIGEAIARQGFLTIDEIEAQAHAYHHGLDVVEVGAPAASEADTGAASAPGPRRAVPPGPRATGADKANAFAEGL